MACSTKSSTSFLLQWSSPPESAINGVLQGYKIRYRAVPVSFVYGSSSILKERKSITTSLLIENLRPFTNYSVSVRGFTRKGDGVPSDLIYCATEEDVPGIVNHFKALSVDQDSIVLSWLPPEEPNGQITTYTLFMGSQQEGDAWPLPASRSVIDMTRQHIEPAHSTQEDPTLPGLPGHDRKWVVAGPENEYTLDGLSEQVVYRFNIRAATAVGEGPLRSTVSQRPQRFAPAAIASFPRTVVGLLDEEIKLECRAVGFPPPSLEWLFLGKKIERSDHHEVRSGDNLVIKKARKNDSGNYTCWASNSHGVDHITYSVVVKASMDTGGLPPVPSLYIKDQTEDSITVTWLPELVHEIQGYYLYLAEGLRNWQRVELPPNPYHHTITDLKCGTPYKVYMTSFNSNGESAPSDVISTRTVGKSPVVPPRSALLQEDVSSVSINLASWRDGGCPIFSFLIEYKKEGSDKWTLVSNVASLKNKAQHTLKNLEEGQRYTVRVSAHNPAGTSVAKFPFITRSVAGGLGGHSMEGGDYLTTPLLAAVSAAVLLVLLTAALAVTFYRRRRSPDDSTTYKDANHVHMELSPSLSLNAESSQERTTARETSLYPSDFHVETRLNSPTEAQRPIKKNSAPVLRKCEVSNENCHRKRKHSDSQVMLRPRFKSVDKELLGFLQPASEQPLAVLPGTAVHRMTSST